MDARPEWVPEWIWGDFDRYRQSDTANPPDIRLIESVLRDEQCKAVWSAIDKRKGEPTRRHNQWCRDRALRTDFIRPGEAEEFFDSLTYFASGVPRGAAIAVSERRKISARIKLHALALRHELDVLERRHDTSTYPASLTDCFIELANAVENEFAERNASSDYSLLKVPHGEAWAAFQIGLMEGLQNVERTLDAIVGAADQWAQTKPAVGHPHDPNAARLYFVREITSYFREKYGTPLREAVAALTRSIYQCEMDAATIAKLAP